EAEKKEGAMVNFDISVPVSKVAHFISEAISQCQEVVAGIRAMPFGHMGDGNIHFNLLQPASMQREVFLQHKALLKDKVYDITHSFGGSISAEHGIGRERKMELVSYKSSVEIALMRAIKKALDPHNIMNPGRMLDEG